VTRSSPLLPGLAVAFLAAGLTACHNRAGPDADADAVVPGGPEVTAEDIDGRPVVRTEELLQGRFPGVRVIAQPGGGIAVRVWPPGTVMGGKDPLYVVDGVPVSTVPGRGLDWLNPGDIASIRVLKDISETAPWGSRGGNGVVVITTRKGDGRAGDGG
jgi:TonB-dependent SusC/RagA subfamily outer membrane receptor